MAVDWPSKFPDPKFDGYGFELENAVTRTVMESGEARQRRLFTDPPAKVNVTWIMPNRTGNEVFKAFEGWFKHTAKGGEEWINMALKNGEGRRANKCRFIGPYSANYISDDIWEVTANLEVQLFATISQNQVTTAIANLP